MSWEGNIVKYAIFSASFLALGLAACGGSDGSSASPASTPGVPMPRDRPSSMQGGTPAQPATNPQEGPMTGPTSSTPPPVTPGMNDSELAMQIVGRYAMQKSVATIQQVPILGDTPTVNKTYGLVEVELDGDRAVMVERNCHSTSESQSSVMTSIPDVVPRSMTELRQPLDVWRDGDRVRFQRPEVVNVMGAHLMHPSEALPTSPTDPRVFDQDQDGHPGVTVKVQGFVTGEIYLVQRLVDQYDGQLDADGRLSALVSDRSESKIIDASNPVLKAGAPVRPDPDASKSNVVFVPLDQAIDCDQLVASIPQMFSN